MSSDIDQCLMVVRNWANERVGTGREPPWAWYQYMKLIDAVDSIRRGRASVTRLGAGSQARSRGPAPQRSDDKKETSAPTGSGQPPDDESGPPPLPM